MENDNTTRIRGVDWIFTAIWAVCGESNVPRCAVNIPITFIFRDGVPIKSLQTNSSSGYIERINLNSIEYFGRQKGERGLQGESMKSLRAMRKLLIQYADENEYGQNNDAKNENDIKICRVYYTDGEVEDLTLQAFDRLIRSDTWRLQVLLLQGFVPFLSEMEGYYSDKPKVRSKLLSDGTVASDQLTRALAHYAEKAFEVSEPLVYGSDSFASNTKIKIKEFQSSFISDPQRRLIFQGSKYLIISILGNRKEVEFTLENEKKSRELTAAKSVALELKKLLQHGQQRGLSMEMIFQHFDTENCGFIDLSMLMNGLAKLGIGVTQPVGESLLQIIGGVGTNYLNIRDMQRFITEIDLEVFERIGQPKDDLSNPRTQPSSSHRVRSIQSVKSFRDEVESQKQQESTFLTNDSTIPKKKSKRSRTQDIEEKAFPSGATLPAPEESYRVNPPSKESATSLPPWATKRQKRALRELNRTQAERKSTRKDPSKNSRSQTRDGMEIGEKYFDLEEEMIDPNGNENQRVTSSQSAGERPLTSTSTTSAILQSSLKELALQYSLEEDVKSCPDDMLHVDHGVMMTYRVLKGSATKSLEQTNSAQSLQVYPLKYRSILEEREKRMRSSCTDEELVQSLYGDLSTKDLNIDGVEREGTLIKRWISFTLIVIPDLFMSLQTLEKYLSPILLRYPLARLILVGLPGLPYTHWPKGWVLNADLHSKSIATLLTHLKSNGNWSPIEDEPILFLGFGSGCYSLSKFIVNYLSSLTWLPRHHIKTIIQVNGYQKITKNYKRICKELRESLLTTSNTVEINELISSLHFWDEYLNQNNRDVVMKEFWSSRKGLISHTSGNSGHSSTQNLQQNSLGYTGILEQLRGILIGPDDPELQSKYLLSQIPILLIHSTENIFQEPNYIQQFYTQQNLHNYSRQLLPSISLYKREKEGENDDNDEKDENLFNSQFLQNGSISINWIRAGHEVLQERTSFILAVISKVVQLLGIEPTTTSKTTNMNNYKNPYEDIDIEKLIEEKIQKEGGGSGAGAGGGDGGGVGVGEGGEKKIIENEEQKVEETINLWKKKKLYHDNGEEEDLENIDEYLQSHNNDQRSPKKRSKGEGVEGEGEEGDEEGEEGDDTEINLSLKENKKKKDKELRKQLIQKRKQRELENSTNEEKLLIKRQQEKLKELKNEKNELNKMRKEDERSLYVEEYYYELEKSLINQEKAKERTNELYLLRRQQALKQVEENLAYEKSKKLEERRIKAEKITKQIEMEQLTMEGEKSGGYNLEYDEIIQKNYRLTSELVTSTLTSKRGINKEIKGKVEGVTVVVTSAAGTGTGTGPGSEEQEGSVASGGEGGGGGDGGDGTRVPTEELSPAMAACLALDNINPNHLIASTQRLLMDITECKNKLIESIKRQVFIEQKTIQYRHQKQGLDYEIRRLRQAIQLLKQNKLMKGMNITNTEKIELEQNLSQKEETFREFCLIGKIREEQLTACNYNIQQLKQILNNLNNLIKNRINNIEKLEKYYSYHIRKYKLDLEDYIVLKDLERNKKILIDERIQYLLNERQRLKYHNSFYVDSDVLIPGFIQRCQTKELKKFLKIEYEKEINKLNNLNKKIDEYNYHIELIAIKQEKIVRNFNKLSLSLRIFYQIMNKINKQSVMNILQDIHHKTNITEKIENKKQNELHNQHLLEGNSAGGGGGGGDGSWNIANGTTTSAGAATSTLANIIRNKNHEIRTKDERKFIGIDMILYPEYYQKHITTTELEEMRYDPDYQIDLDQHDIQRIMKLPEQINLALPFLSTIDEINGHRLCNKYYRNKGDEYYRKADYLSSEIQENNTTSNNSSNNTNDTIFANLGNNLYLTPDDMRQAEIIHEILIKEIRRDRIRAITPGEEHLLSKEEKLWLSMDRILSPYVYGEIKSKFIRRDRDDEPDEFSTNIPNPTTSTTTTTTSTTTPTPTLAISGQSYELNNQYNGDDLRYLTMPKNNLDHPVDGDKYQEIRWEYENGEVIFHDLEYHCPYTREELLHIRSLPIIELTNEQLKYRNLMDKYYVHEDESLYGQNRLETLLEVTKELYEFIHEQDHIIQTAEEKNNKNYQKTLLLNQIDENNPENDHTDTSTATGSNTSSIHRIFGSWEVVHPASAGVYSQNNYFQISSYNASRDHPASFAIHKNNEQSLFDLLHSHLQEDDDNNQHSLHNNDHIDDEISDTIRIEQGVQSLLHGPTSTSMNKRRNQFSTTSTGTNNLYLIVDSIKVLAQQDPKIISGKIVLITSSTPGTLYEINNQELQSRQSRSHQFEIPEKDNMRVLEITISILYQGSFGNRGYKLGRLAAALYRLPDTKTSTSSTTNTSALPQAIGYAPYKLQSPNLPDQIGRIILLHKPKSKPIPSGIFQIILGAASTCKYSIEVTCKYAQNALYVIDPLIENAKQYQSRLPICLKELDDLQIGLRLAERKLLVVNKMILEAETETIKCQKNISLITEKLNHDDETMEYTEDERKDLINEQSIIEIEFATWASIYASRCREKEDIYQGITMMHRFQRERQDEKLKLKEQLTELRRDLPTCIGLLRTYQEAANVAISLNTTVQGRIAATTESTLYSSTSNNTSIRIQTPADIVRRRYQRDGWNTLTLEEQQWTMLDMSLCPHKYEWLTEREEEENFKRLEMGKKPKKKKKYNLAIEQYRLSKVDIGRILAQPFAMLTRHEMNVRKLLTKYHDDPEIIKRNRNIALFNFDPRRAERTRSKQYAAMSKEEREWASIDKVLHPEVWAYYHHDDEAKAWLDHKGKGALLNNQRKNSMIGGGSVADRLKRNQTIKENIPSPTTATATGTGTVTARGQGESNDLQDSSTSQEQQQQQYVDTLTRILDPNDTISTQRIQTEAKYRKGSDGLQGIVNEVHKSLPTQGIRNTNEWQNTYDKDHLIRIWKATNPQLLKNDEERYVYRLLHKYNGSYGAYVELALQAQKRRMNNTRLGSHVRWDVHGLIVNPDIDGRARELLEELDRAIANKNFWMDSLVLHTNDQRFPTAVLRLQLEDALDTVLADQIRERERVDRMSAAQKGHDDETSDEESSDSDNDGTPGEEDMTMSKVQARAARRDRRRLKVKQETLQQEVLIARRLIIERNKTGEIIDESILLKELGINGCLACRTPTCQWKPSVDEIACNERIKELNQEIERIRRDPDQNVWYSTIALSAQLGGNTAFNRDDLLDELIYEVREIERRIHLNNIDKELHDCYQTRNEYVEVKYLHGYSSVLWTNNARKALNARQERLIAMNISQEIIDDILDYMLEGWYFGERESNYHLIGYIPSIKKDGIMNAGQEQVQSVGLSIAKAKQRYENKLKGIISFEAMRGELEEKLMPIEMKNRQRLEDKRIAKEGTDYHHRLNETEQTLKFGLFMLTFMYFRAMAFVKREQRSWSGIDDALDEKNIKMNNKKDMTDERRKMLDEESKLQARKKKMDIILGRAREGEARKRDREAKERKEAIQKLQEIVRRQRREKEAINHIQRVYRGHLGRKAAKRWAMKRAEMTAINALLNAAAICLQRVWRGWLGRKEAKETRAEMAYFIALMRAQEAEQDEEEYWETHQWERYKKNARKFVNEQFRAEHAYKTLGGKAFGDDSFNEDENGDN